MFYSIFRSCKGQHCSHGSKKEAKQRSHRQFRKLNKQKLSQGYTEIIRLATGCKWFA